VRLFEVQINLQQNGRHCLAASAKPSKRIRILTTLPVIHASAVSSLDSPFNAAMEQYTDRKKEIRKYEQLLRGFHGVPWLPLKYAASDSQAGSGKV